MKRSAFTLLELLAVIAIIAALVGMLFPVLGVVKESGQGAQCSSNLRQLAAANLAYAADHEGHYVAAQDRTNNIRWHGVRTASSQPFDPTKGPLAPYLGAEGRVKLCPTFRDALQGKNTFEQGTGGFGYNSAYIGGLSSDYYTSQIVANVPQPVRTVMFTDTAFARSTGVQEYAYCEPFEWVDPNGQLSGALSASVHFRHRSRANVAWCDGHVSAELPSKIDGKNVYGGDAHQWKIGWFGPSEDNGFWNPQAIAR